MIHSLVKAFYFQLGFIDLENLGIACIKKKCQNGLTKPKVKLINKNTIGGIYFIIYHK